MTDSRAFPPEARLHSKADFAALRRCRKPFRGRLFIVRHVPGERASARLGMAVSRKVSKRAVVRNRIKRCIRESFRHHRSVLPVCDLLLIALPAAAQVSHDELHAELGQHWQRLKSLHAGHVPPITTGGQHADRDSTPT